MRRTIGLLAALSTLSGCGVAVGAATLAAVNQAGKSGANRTVQISQMNCTQLRAEYNRTKGFSLNPVNTAAHAATLDAMRARGCRLPS